MQDNGNPHIPEQHTPYVAPYVVPGTDRVSVLGVEYQTLTSIAQHLIAAGMEIQNPPKVVTATSKAEHLRVIDHHQQLAYNMSFAWGMNTGFLSVGDSPDSGLIER